MLLTFENITKHHNETCILDHVSFSIEEKDKIALIGVNGTGKSTLLNIMMQLEPYESGNILKKKELKIAYLSQYQTFDETKTVWEIMKDANAQETKEYEMKSILHKLGLFDLQQKVAFLSGGQQKRLALAQVLLTPCDLYLLDEPTNHLDHEMISWLQEYLKKTTKAVFMVTHDRYFMEYITSRMLELDHGNIYAYEGNYTTYMEQKQLREDLQLQKEKKRQQLFKKELAWVRAGVQARGTKSKDRLQRFEQLQKERGFQKEDALQMDLKTARLGKKIMELHQIGMTYDDKTLFHDLNYTVKKQDRIGILGPNGCGKSTLLKILAKQIQPTTGEVILGDTVKLGFFRQGIEDMDLDQRIIDYIQEVKGEIHTEKGQYSASQMLERFLFHKNMHYQTIARLSGGEKRRLYLLRVLMMAPNVLLLDEPTNDFDIATLQVLEDYLDEFSGVVFVVSHDRYFLDRVCETLFVFTAAGTIQQCIGGYSQYMEMQKMHQLSLKQENTMQQHKQQKQKIPSMSTKEKKELAQIEEEILEIEMQIEKIDQLMNQQSEDYEAIMRLANEREVLHRQQEEKTQRWILLEEKKQELEAFIKRK